MKSSHFDWFFLLKFPNQRCTSYKDGQGVHLAEEADEGADSISYCGSYGAPEWPAARTWAMCYQGNKRPTFFHYFLISFYCCTNRGDVIVLPGKQATEVKLFCLERHHKKDLLFAGPKVIGPQKTDLCNAWWTPRTSPLLVIASQFTKWFLKQAPKEVR